MSRSSTAILTALLFLFPTGALARPASTATAASTTSTAVATAPGSLSSAQALLPFKAKVQSPDVSGKGIVTIDGDTIEIEIHRVFSTEAHAFEFGDARAVHLRRTLFHTDILLNMQDASEVRIRTKHREYDTLKGALKTRIAKG